MQIAFQVIADGADVTAKIGDRLLELTLTDEAGQTADTAEIEIDDRDYRVALPEVGAKLTISVGFKGALVEIGQYVVDDISGQVGPDTMTISAKSADMRAGIKSPRTRAWECITVGDLVEKIAGEHGLRPQISDSLKGVVLDYVAQTTESDLNLLTRVARDLGATVKPAGGAIVFVKTGEGKAADGTDLPVFVVHRTQMTSASWQLTGRGVYGRVVAEWSERDSATVHKVTAGKDDPEQVLRTRYASKAAARRAADAALDRSKRGGGTISVELGGFWGDLTAEAKVDLQGIKSELTGEWLITRVTHRLSGTLTTSFDAERDNEEAKKDG
jgi:hypothetical protein